MMLLEATYVLGEEHDSKLSGDIRYDQNGDERIDSQEFT